MNKKYKEIMKVSMKRYEKLNAEMEVGHFVVRSFCGLGRFVVGTFCGLEVLWLRHLVVGHFVVRRFVVEPYVGGTFLGGKLGGWNIF